MAFDARFVSDRYHGIGRHAYNLLEALTRLDRGRRFLVYFNPALVNSRFDLGVLGQRRNVELYPVDLPLYGLREQAFWPRELKQRGVGLFHSPYVTLPMLPVPSGPRLLMTVHDLILERFPQYMPRTALRHFYGAQTRLSIRRAASVLTISRATQGDVEAYYPAAAGKVRVIGGAVDASFAPERDPTRLAEVRARYALPARFALTVGAGRPHKNVGIVVEALARLDPAIMPALVVAGESDSRFGDEVGVRADSLGVADRVVRTGAVRETDLPAVYAMADVFVFPSLVEGYGLPPLEAMACGTPVIASNASSIPEVVGEAALPFDPMDATQLCRLLMRVLSDRSLRNDLQLRGRERARHLTWDRVAGAALDVYGEVLAEVAPGSPALGQLRQAA